MPAYRTPRATIDPSGDSAIRVVAALDDREASWRLVHHLARSLDRADIPGVVCAIPTYDAVLIELDPVECSAPQLTSILTWMIDEIDPDLPLSDAPRSFEVPVLYDLDGTLDLATVAQAQELTPEEIVALHSEPTYVVRCLGAPGGSPMLDGPAFPHPVPRLSSPRPHVPQGVVSVAGRQATITPAAAPGGWQLIGRTPLTVLDLTSEPFVPYAPGDLLTFRPIERDEYARLLGTRMVAR